MKYIEIILQNPTQAIVYLIIFILAVIELIELTNKSINLLGIETKWSLKEKKETEKLKIHDEILNEIPRQIKEITDKLDKLTIKLNETNNKLKEQVEKTTLHERNKLRDRLLQSYRFYTSSATNPSCSWNKMEAEAFWKLFSDYEDCGGDGYMHTVVQPEMNKITVTDMP